MLLEISCPIYLIAASANVRSRWSYDVGLCMLPFKLVYSDAYFLPIGTHVFPAEKYRRVRDRLLATKVAGPEDFLEPQPASDQDILLVHKPDYVQRLKTGTLSPRAKKWRWRSLTRANWSTLSG